MTDAPTIQEREAELRAWLGIEGMKAVATPKSPTPESPMTPLDLPALDVSGLAERALQDGKSWLERCRETTMYEGHPAVVINRLVDALTRLSAERDALIADNAELVGINADLSTRVEALEAALKPFADLGVSAYGPDDEHDDASYRLTRGSIRQARKALQAEGER